MRKKTPRATTSFDEQVGERIKARRIAREMSQTDLADALGVSFQQIQKYESGSNRLAFVRALEIAKILDCSLDWLAGLEAAVGAAYEATNGSDDVTLANVKLARRIGAIGDQMRDAIVAMLGAAEKRKPRVRA